MLGRTGSSVEMSSDAETRKFEKLGPIRADERRSTDLDDLCRRLAAS